MPIACQHEQTKHSRAACAGLTAIVCTVRFVVPPGEPLVRLLAVVTRDHVVALAGVVGAHAHIISKHDNILPRGGVPVGIVVPFFRTFVSTAIPVGILTSVNCRAVSKLIVT